MNPGHSAQAVAAVSPSPGDAVPDYVLELERAASYLPREQLPLLREAIAHADSIGDYVSRQLFVKILDSEEEHVDWLETQLDLIGRIGEPNYLLSKLED